METKSFLRVGQAEIFSAPERPARTSRRRAAQHRRATSRTAGVPLSWIVGGVDAPDGGLVRVLAAANNYMARQQVTRVLVRWRGHGGSGRGCRDGNCVRAAGLPAPDMSRSGFSSWPSRGQLGQTSAARGPRCLLLDEGKEELLQLFPVRGGVFADDALLKTAGDDGDSGPVQTGAGWETFLELCASKSDADLGLCKLRYLALKPYGGPRALPDAYA
jgi:hypothetical protein